MKRICIFILTTLLFKLSSAENVCANIESKKISDRSLMVRIEGKKSIIKTTHSIQDFSLSKSGKWIVVYGADYSKSSMAGTEVNSGISVFQTSNFHKAKKVIFVGKGVYEIIFDNNENNIYISNTYGLVKINTSNFKAESYGIESNKYDLSQYLGACKDIHLQY